MLNFKLITKINRKILYQDQKKILAFSQIFKKPIIGIIDIVQDIDICPFF